MTRYGGRVAQCTGLQTRTPESSNLSRTSKEFANILRSIGASAFQLSAMIDFGLKPAFEEAAKYEKDRLFREDQAKLYPKNWLLIKVPGYSEPMLA